MQTADLKIRQLDAALKPLAKRGLAQPPRVGWVKAIRVALGITTRQFAKRLNLAQATVVQAEQSEAAGTITLAQLRRLASALDCDLFYALVPRVPLAQRVDAQAERKARDQVAGVAHTMALEAQGTGVDFHARQIAETKAELLRRRRSRLWD